MAGLPHPLEREAEAERGQHQRGHSPLEATSSLEAPCPLLLPLELEAGEVRTGQEARTESRSCLNKFSLLGMVGVRRMGATGGAKTGIILPHLLLAVAVAVVLLLPGQEVLEATQRQALLRPRPLTAEKEAAATTAGAPWVSGGAPRHRLLVDQEAQAPCLRHPWDTRAGAGLRRHKALVSQASCQTSWELRPRLLLRVN